MLSVATKASETRDKYEGLFYTCDSARQSDVNGGELLKYGIGSSFVLGGNKVFFQIADDNQTPAQKLKFGEAIAAVFGFQDVPDSRRCLLPCFCEKQERPQAPLHYDFDCAWVFLGKMVGEESDVEADELARSCWGG